MTEESDDAGIADEAKNLTPNPLPIVGRGTKIKERAADSFV
jgi:hypothetical protein